MKPTHCFLPLLVTCCAEARAQANLTGAVLDAAGKPLPFATVALLHTRDSSMAKGTASDERGLYAFDNIKAGWYVVRATAIGYQKAYSAAFEVTTLPVRIQPVMMVEMAGQLTEVQVSAKKPFVEQLPDRTVINVAQSIIGSGSTALEVLEKSPGVVVDYQNERLQLRGKEGVIVQLDGKQTYLSAQDVIGLLRSMSSDNIEKVELITNPGARYDASGNSGIINIVLKKNTDLGTNGTLSAGAGTGRYDRERGSLQLNHRSRKANLFATYSLNRGGSYWHLELDNWQKDPGPNAPDRQNIARQTTYLHFLDIGQNAKAGIDMMLSKRTTVGLVWTGLWSSRRERGPADALFRRAESGPAYFQAQTDKFLDRISQSHIGNLNMQHTFGGKKGQLTADMDWGHFSRSYSNQLLTERLLETADKVPDLPGALLVTQPTTIRIRTVRADYSVLPAGGWKLETGFKLASVRTDNTMEVFTGTLQEGQLGLWHPDPTGTNIFRYTENVGAAYISASGKPGRKTEVQLGLRAEYTHSAGNSVSLRQQVERRYLKWFPSLFVTRTLQKGQALGFSYGYRIDRPDYQGLNPAPAYANPYAYYVGNPYLRPQFTHAMEVKYSLKNQAFAALAYSRTTDLIYFTIHALEGNKTYVTFENLDRFQGYTLTVGMPLTITKGWQLQTNWLAYYNRFRYTYEETVHMIDNLSGRLNVGNALTLGKGWTAEINGWVSTPAMNGIRWQNWLGSLDMGLQKSIGRGWQIKLSGQDLLHTNRNMFRVDTENYGGLTRLTLDTRIVLLNLTCKFGNQRMKADRQRRSASDEEIRRAN